jgi:uncharacterized protein
VPPERGAGAGLSLLSPADYRRVRWKNGRGWTTELAVQPARGDFDWRVSIADVDADSEFSRFPGIDRSILVLAGEGLELQVGSEPPFALRAADGSFGFSGDLAVHARLIRGPTRDFNVMTRRGQFEHVLGTRTLGEPLHLERQAGEGWLIYLLRGTARIDMLDVVAGQSVLSGPEIVTRPPVLLGGAGELVLVRLTRTQP